MLLEPNEEGGWTAEVPALPGCVSEGETPEEALRNAKEAIEAYLEALKELKKPLPVELEVEVPG